jgi:hypothetical protein
MDMKINPSNWPIAHQLAWMVSNPRTLYVVRRSDGRKETMTHAAAVSAIKSATAKLVVIA